MIVLIKHRGIEESQFFDNVSEVRTEMGHLLVTEMCSSYQRVDCSCLSEVDYWKVYDKKFEREVKKDGRKRGVGKKSRK